MKKNKSFIFIIIGVLVIVAFLAIGFIDFPNKGNDTENNQTESETNTETASDDTETETDMIPAISLEEFFGESALNPGESASGFAYNSFSGLSIATMAEEQLYTRNLNMLYSCDLDGEQLTLVEKLQVPVSYQPFYDYATETLYLLRYNSFTIDIYRMMEDGTAELVTKIEENSFNDRNPIVIEGGKCYYFSRENGYVLKAIDLVQPEQKVEIYRWEESLSDTSLCISTLQVDNRYIVVEHSQESKYAGVSVYDKKELKLIIASEESMNEPYYRNGKLYYLNSENAQICMVDLSSSTEPKELVKLTNTGTDYELLADNDYLYLRTYDYEIEECFFDIYTLDGAYVDTISLKENKDAADRKFYQHKTVSRVLYTTDDYVFIGEVSAPGASGWFYLKKDKIGTEELVIYSLYLSVK